MPYLFINMCIFYFTKIILDQSHKLSYIFLLKKFQICKMFSFFFISFSFSLPLPFLLFFSLSSFLSFLRLAAAHATGSSDSSPMREIQQDAAPKPSPPTAPQPAAPPAPALISPPPYPLQRAHMAGHGAQSPAMAALPWRAPTKDVFLHGTTKWMYKTFLFLFTAPILSETNSNLWILRDFVFKRNLDFISNSKFNPSGLLPHRYISLGAPSPCIPMPVSPQN
jgi:hypothetical protein